MYTTYVVQNKNGDPLYGAPQPSSSRNFIKRGNFTDADVNIFCIKYRWSGVSVYQISFEMLMSKNGGTNRILQKDLDEPILKIEFKK